MSFRFPLYTKILLWFFLNLILLGGGLYAFVRFQFHIGLDSLVSGDAENRLEAVSTVIERELRDASAESKDAVLERFSSAYEGVEFFLFRPNGTQIAGAPTELPAEVRGRFQKLRGPLGPPPPPNAGEQIGRQRWKRMTESPAVNEARPRRPHPKFMVRTENPVRYWVGIRLFPARRAFVPNEQEVLIAASRTLRGGGLFFDVGPWAKVAFGALAFSVLFWLPLVRSITRSISQMTHATEQVAQGNFDVRVDAGRRDELGRLGQAINGMTERLAGFVRGQKRFLGDAAHELCSPLARIEVALGILEARSEAALHPRIADVREEAREMASLVNEILAFSKASLRGKEIQLEPVPLRELVCKVTTRESGDFTAAQSDVAVEIPQKLQALAAPDLLRRAMANLIRNAMRYAGDAGPIRVHAETRNGKIYLTVSDSGFGVPEKDLQQLCDPFFRLDAARSRETGGFGLGLAIVKTCVEACGGSVVARNRQPSGLEVEITLTAAEV